MASKLSAINEIDILDEKRRELEAHIAKFPSSLDGTSIGIQLRNHGVETQLYDEIRDSLWFNYQKLKHYKEDIERTLLDWRNEIDRVL